MEIPGAALLAVFTDAIRVSLAGKEILKKRLVQWGHAHLETSRRSYPPKKLKSSLINFFPVPYSQDEAIIPYNGIDYPVVTDAIFSEACKLALEHRIGISIRGKLLFDFIQDAISLRLGHLFQITLDRFLVDNIISQAISSALCPK